MRKLLVLIICLAFPATADAHRHHHHHARTAERAIPWDERATPWEERWLAAGDKEWEEAELSDPYHQIFLPKAPTTS